MFGNEVSLGDLFEQRIRSNMEEIDKLKPDDQNRSKLITETKTVADMALSFEQGDRERLNNNARNDIDEQKLRIEERKLDLEERRVKNERNRTWVYIVGAFGMTSLSYMADTIFQKVPAMGRAAEKLHDLITRK